MFSNVTKWLGVVDNTVEDDTLAVNAEGDENPVDKPKKSDDEPSETTTKDAGEEAENDDLISPQTKQTLEEVSANAISTAKEWGC
ncbi:hypothetical protein DPMN_103157 [Dreissena polymorpha]|uniref:Uncharacterized protein n=1 Tax=Dreissena polymorpha TaxID=45954 RepID=A0A9D4JZU9_DREPO|nr:hypothetical protein DPMN_103157 [Dreissena polymorpha]